MELNELEKNVSSGESETVEFKKSTAQLTRAGETLCAFLNSQGGRVLVGVTPEGKIVGQQIADSTLPEVAAMLARFEPPALISQERLRLPNGSEVLILSAPAVVLFGKESVFDYPQRQLRLAWFKGTDKSEFRDNRQMRGHAFALLDEAMTFLHRHLPISGRFEPERLERIDELLFPTAALRETLVNALCHRDYSVYGGAINVAVYDDRTEIWSDGTLPFGLRPEDLIREHSSHPRNPFITEVFYRRGLIEQWGRGTNKIVALCDKVGLPKPEFGQQAGSVFVRFRPLDRKAAVPAVGQVTEQVTEQVGRLLAVLQARTLKGSEVMEKLGLLHRPTFVYSYVQPAMERGLVEMSIPDKPRSRLQKYRLTEKGKAMVASLVTDQVPPPRSEPSHARTDQAPGTKTGPKS